MSIFATNSPEVLTGAYGCILLAPFVSAAANVVVEHWLSPWMALRSDVNIASVDWSLELLADSNAPTEMNLELLFQSGHWRRLRAPGRAQPTRGRQDTQPCCGVDTAVVTLLARASASRAPTPRVLHELFAWHRCCFSS